MKNKYLDRNIHEIEQKMNNGFEAQQDINREICESLQSLLEAIKEVKLKIRQIDTIFCSQENINHQLRNMLFTLNEDIMNLHNKLNTHSKSHESHDELKTFERIVRTDYTDESPETRNFRRMVALAKELDKWLL